jgi:hypothetical protein
VHKSANMNTPTEDLIKSMTDVAATMRDSFTALLSAAVRLAEAGQDEEARRLLDLAKALQAAEDKMVDHTKDARAGRIVKLNLH